MSVFADVHQQTHKSSHPITPPWQDEAPEIAGYSDLTGTSVMLGAPEEIRTPDPQIRSLRLPYPADRSSEIYFRTVCNAMTPLVRAA
jgi:hypothetical protein